MDIKNNVWGESRMTTEKCDFLSPKQFETEYGVPVGTQAVWRCTGRYGLPYVKVGHNVRYRRSAIEAWLESRTVNGEGTEGHYNDWD